MISAPASDAVERRVERRLRLEHLVLERVLHLREVGEERVDQGLGAVVARGHGQVPALAGRDAVARGLQVLQRVGQVQPRRVRARLRRHDRELDDVDGVGDVRVRRRRDPEVRAVEPRRVHRRACVQDTFDMVHFERIWRQRSLPDLRRSWKQRRALGLEERAEKTSF